MEDDLTYELKRELRKRMSLTRLAKTGFFKRIPAPDPSIEGEVLLHRTVLDKALMDTFSTNEEIKDEVDDWLDLDNEDFLEACDRALLPPEGVYKAFKAFKKILRGENARFKTVDNWKKST